MLAQTMNKQGDLKSLPFGLGGSVPITHFGPRYLDWARKGYLFSARATAAQALIIFSTATNAPTLWNPQDSPNIVIPLRINLWPVAVASAVHTGVVLGIKKNCGSQASTAGAFPTFTNKAPDSLSPWLNKACRTLYSDAVITFTAIPTMFVDLGAGQLAAAQPLPPSVDLEGLVMLGPGDAMTVMGQAASVNTFWMSIIFAEIPASELQY